MVQNKTFWVGNLELNYFDHPYNNTKVNERTVEIPLGQHFFKIYESIIEVGAVMPYYISNPNHLVIDMFDPHPLCIKDDAADYSYTGKNVLSISAIEHIGTSDYGATPSRDPSIAFKTVLKILKGAKRYLITWPIAYNSSLDEDLYTSKIPYRILGRLDNINNWAQDSNRDNLLTGKYKYGMPHTCGNGLVILTNDKQILGES